jgi:hypothetical protein
MMSATPVSTPPKTHLLARLLPALATAFMLAQPCFAQSQPSPATGPAVSTFERAVTATERRETIEELAKDLYENFVFPEVATRYASMLRANLAAGKYDHLSDPVALGKQVTSDLQVIAPDGHLRFGPESSFMQMKPDAQSAQSAKPRPPALAETKMIGNVAYLQFNAFPHDAAIAATARQFLLDHADARAVIIDSRTNRGGDLTIMDQIFPLLFAQPATLARMDTRAVEGARAPSESMVRRDSPKEIVRHDHVVTPDTRETRLQTVPVYYLVSKKTASAAEHTALAFKRTGRAQLIGQTTGGYGHYGGLSKQGERFATFIPVGRTYDPDTNWDWEGVGVAPDVVVDSDAALDEALKRANGAQVAQAKAVASPAQ